MRFFNKSFGDIRNFPLTGFKITVIEDLLTYCDQLEAVLKKVTLVVTINRRPCMKALMPVDEAKYVCPDHSKRKVVVSA